MWPQVLTSLHIAARLGSGLVLEGGGRSLWWSLGRSLFAKKIVSSICSSCAHACMAPSAAMAAARRGRGMSSISSSGVSSTLVTPLAETSSGYLVLSAFGRNIVDMSAAFDKLAWAPLPSLPVLGNSRKFFSFSFSLKQERKFSPINTYLVQVFLAKLKVQRTQVQDFSVRNFESNYNS